MKSVFKRKTVIHILIVWMFMFTFIPSGWCLGNYAKRSAGKFGRGVTNIVFSEAEIFTSFEKGIEAGDAYKLFLIAPVRGVAWMLGRALVGVYEVATFWVPQKPILKPPYFSSNIQEYLKENNDAP